MSGTVIELAKRKPRRRSTFKAPVSDIFARYAAVRGPASRRAIAFIERECRVPSGRGAGQPYRLLAFQKRAIRRALDGGALTAVISGPRGIGKTGLAAALLVWALFDREGAQVLAASTSMRTAQLSYGRAVRMIELNPRLREQAMIYRNAAEPWVELPARGATLRPLPAEERHIVGFAPSLIVVDEIGYVSRSTYEAMQTSLGKMPDTLLLGFGTPGLGTMDGSEPNLMWQLRTLAGSDSPPPTLVYIEHAARATDDPGDKRAWKRANPGLGTLVDPRAIAHDYATMPPSRFGQMRLGLWTQHESAWMPAAIWDALEVVIGKCEDGTLVALGFDGSTSGDATALVALELASGRVVVLGYWERPAGAHMWSVPRYEVMAAIDEAMTRLSVVGLLADPWGWRSELQELAARYGDRVMEFNTASSGRMGPATDAFLAAAMKQELAWDGTPALRAHVLAAVAKRTVAGDVIVKDAKRPQLIDLAVASILAHEAARTFEEPVRPGIW